MDCASRAAARPCCIPTRTRSGSTSGRGESRIRASSRRRTAPMCSRTRSGIATSPASRSRRPRHSHCDIRQPHHLDAAGGHARQAPEGPIPPAGAFRLLAGRGGAARSPDGARHRRDVQRGKQRDGRRPDPSGTDLYGRTSAVRSARSPQAGGPLGRALHPAHGRLRADRTVPAGHDVCGGAGPVSRTLVSVLRDGGLAGGRGRLGSEAHDKWRTASMTLVKMAPPLEQDVDLSKTYDAVIVGSGAAGGMAAHVLTTHGLKVLMLEAGKKLPIEQELRSMQWPYDHPRRGDAPPGSHHLSFNEYTIRKPPYAKGAAFKHVYSYVGGWSGSDYVKNILVDEKDHPYTGTNYAWVRARCLGGKTNIWGRLALRLSDYDVKVKTHDGYGEDWPISYADLEPYYDKVDLYLGISGHKENL